MGFVLRALINAVTIYFVLPAVIFGVTIRGPQAALIAGLVLGLINAIVRPILVVLTFPLTLLTLGLFLLVLNGFCLWLASTLVPGFEVNGFWAAVLGALLISVVSWLSTAFLSDSGRLRRI